MNKIKEFQGKYRFLSNFWPVGNVERQYQAAKFFDPKIQAEILMSASPGEAKKLSRKYKDKIRPDWEKVNILIMLNLLYKKFSIPEMKEKLLATGNSILEEGNNWGDEFWGINLKTGEGSNWLGFLLMKVREELKMLTIRFSHNWNNKLDGKVFTTIRKFEQEKFTYYKSNVGKKFAIDLNDKNYGFAKLLEAYEENISNLNCLLMMLDTGMSDMVEILELFKKFGVRDKVIVLLFEKV